MKVTQLKKRIYGNNGTKKQERILFFLHVSSKNIRALHCSLSFD